MRKRHIVPLAVIALMAAASVFAVLHFDELQERIYDGRKASERSALKDPVFADVETGNFFACGLTTSAISSGLTVSLIICPPLFRRASSAS